VRRIERHRDALSNRRPLRGHQNLQICRSGCVSAVTPLCFDVCHICGRPFAAGCDVAHGLVKQTGQARPSWRACWPVRGATGRGSIKLTPFCITATQNIGRRPSSPPWRVIRIARSTVERGGIPRSNNPLAKLDSAKLRGAQNCACPGIRRSSSPGRSQYRKRASRNDHVALRNPRGALGSVDRTSGGSSSVTAGSRKNDMTAAMTQST
jgi:hypothetical protein